MWWIDFIFSFSQHYYFFSSGGGGKELKSWSIVRKFLLLSDCIEQSVDEGFCHVVMSPSPTVTEGSVQTWSHTAHPFVLWTARSLFTHWNSLPVFPVRWSEMLRFFSPPSFALPFLPSLVSHPPTGSSGVRGAHKRKPGAGELGQVLPSAAELPWS